MIGIIGAGGAIGSRVAHALAGDPTAGRLRLGARDVGRIAVFGDRVEPCAVDLHDAEALARFCSGCRVVVNGAGPSYRVLDTVARAALEAGADYVDPAGDDPVHALLTPLDLAALGRRAVVSAGLLPGLSGLLPRGTAAAFDTVERVQAYVGGLAPITPAAAGDFLLSDRAGTGEPLAAWHGGRRRSRALVPLRGVRLPFFPDEVTAYPYLPTEVERLAADLGAREAHWYNVFPTGRAERLLSTLWATPDRDLDAAAATLDAAIALDLVGRAPYHLMVLQLHGRAGGRAHTRTLVVRSTDGYAPTAAMTVAAVRAVSSEAVPPGVHYAADVLDPTGLRARLDATPDVSVREVGDEMPLFAMADGIRNGNPGTEVPLNNPGPADSAHPPATPRTPGTPDPPGIPGTRGTPTPSGLAGAALFDDEGEL